MPDDPLCVLAQTCSAALLALRTPAPTPAPAPGPVLADIDALLALVDALSTKFTLALAPPAPAYPAAVPLLRDLAQHASALAHSVCLLRDDLHGATLIRHVSSRVHDIIDALRALALSFLHNTHDHLLRTATLHDLITDARGSSGIPRDNQAAVHRAWKSDRDTIDDNLREIALFIKQAEPHDNPRDDLQDGWDEIGLEHPSHMEADELVRAKNVHQILRLTTLLHKRIFLDLLPYPSSASSSAFDALLLQSNLLLSTSDDLVAALYPPQDPDHVRNEILQLANIATSLQSQLSIFLLTPDQLPVQLDALTLQDGTTLTTSSKKRADKKWFDTCVNQTLRLCSNLTGKPS